MKAVVLEGAGESPVLMEWPEPEPQIGTVLLDVQTAGLGGWDIAGAYRLGVEFPCVVRGEGVGRASDGRRLYFGERSALPYGAFAERTLVPIEEAWEVPDDIDDATAILMGIAGTGVLLPLEEGRINAGDAVLVLGGSGALGRLALVLARHLGAGRVVAAARSAEPLEEIEAAGLADAVVTLGRHDDSARLTEASGGAGFDVVLDLVYGKPFEAALKATRVGARLVTVGTLAGSVASVPAGDMLFRTHTTIGTGQRTPQVRRDTWLRLLNLSRSLDLSVPTVSYPLDDGPAAWAAQAASPHGKVLVAVGPAA